MFNCICTSKCHSLLEYHFAKVQRFTLAYQIVILKGKKKYAHICTSKLCVRVWLHILITENAGVSRGKGQDLFLRAFDESLRLIQEQKLQVPSIHAVIVGSDMTVQTKFETELRNFVLSKKIQHRVHFVNKTLTVAPYLAAVDVLVQNSQVFLSTLVVQCLYTCIVAPLYCSICFFLPLMFD